MIKYTATVTISGSYSFQLKAENQDQAYELAQDNFLEPSEIAFWDMELEITEDDE